MGLQSEMLGLQKFNSDILHQNLICYAAKTSTSILKRDFLSCIVD